jgi:outer membrane protein
MARTGPLADCHGYECHRRVVVSTMRAVGMLVLASLPSLASAARHLTGELVVEAAQQAQWNAEAEQLMLEGRLAEADAILDARLLERPSDIEARFLKGMLAEARKDNRRAIRIFRSILIDQPKATRVRLELARAFYLVNDYGNALRQFQFALASDPPEEVATNIRHYIGAIRRAKSISYNVGISIAPDSNLNTGSSAREVSLFGLPFDLSEEARQRSGVGVSLEAGGEWAPSIGRSTRFRMGIDARRRDYSGAKFDDMTVAAYAGPRVLAGKWDMSLLGTAYQRWYGAKPYNRAFGLRAEASYYATGRLAISAATSAQVVRHHLARERDGLLTSVNAGAYYALTSSSAATLKTGVSRNAARVDPYSSWSAFAAAGYFRELPMGFSVYVEPSYSVAHYDAPLAAFGKIRSDSTSSLLLTVLNRHLVLSRFTPRVSFTWTHQGSSIPLYGFTRKRLEVGFTTEF